FLLMVAAYVRYTRAPSITRYLAVALLFAAGLMSKPMLVSAPVILLLLDYWPLERIKNQNSEVRARKSGVSVQRRVLGGLILEKLPLLLPTACSCVIHLVVKNRSTGGFPPWPCLWRVENAFATCVIYV